MPCVVPSCSRCRDDSILAALVARAEPSVAEIEKQIDEKWTQLEPRSISTTPPPGPRRPQKQAAALAKKISPLQLQVELAMQQVPTSSSRTTSRPTRRPSCAARLRAVGATEVLGSSTSSPSARPTACRRSPTCGRSTRPKAPLDALIAELTQTEKASRRRPSRSTPRSKAAEAAAAGVRVRHVSGDLGRAVPVGLPGGKAGVAVKFACARSASRTSGAPTDGWVRLLGAHLRRLAQAGVSLPPNAAAQRGP